MKVISGSTNKEPLFLYVCVYWEQMLKGKVFEIVSFKLAPVKVIIGSTNKEPLL